MAVPAINALAFDTGGTVLIGIAASGPRSPLADLRDRQYPPAPVAE
jgi:hypothetical protein